MKTPLAIILTHGMGQQAPFETVTEATEALRRLAPQLKAEAETVVLQGKPVTRVLLSDSTGCRAHLYEAYWAPLADEAITLRQTLAWLLFTGLAGLRRSFNKSLMERWVAGQKRTWHETASLRQLADQPLSDSKANLVQVLFWLCLGVLFLFSWSLVVHVTGLGWQPTPNAFWLRLYDQCTISLGPGAVFVPTGIVLAALSTFLYLGMRPTARYLLVILMVVGAFLSINLTLGTTLAKPHLSDFTAATLALNLIFFYSILLTVGVSFCALVAIYRRQPRPTMPPALRLIQRLLVWVTLFCLVLYGLAIPFQTFTLKASDFARFSHEGLSPFRPAFVWLQAIVESSGFRSVAWLWWVFLGLSLMAQRFLKNYMGDVAIVVSEFGPASRLSSTRKEIQAAVMETFGQVYSQPYASVLCVGHSLGSVLTYDALNAAVLRNPDWAKKTPLLLTFGSPLNKIAFLFRVLGSGKDSDITLALEACNQPLLQNPTQRPLRWINIWSPDDPVSGSLRYYDPPEGQLPSWPRIENKEDPQGYIWGASHTHYWQNDLLPQTLLAAICPPQAPTPQPEQQDTGTTDGTQRAEEPATP